MSGTMELPGGPRLKFRTEGEWIVATAWLGGKPAREIARLWRGVADEVPDAEYQEWAHLTGKLFVAATGKAVGLPVQAKIRMPDYTGERRP